jgi:hypothetical protein
VRLALALVVLAGCDRLLGVDPLQVPGDGQRGDSAGDAVTPHDEDGDGIDDSIDLCPADFDQTMPQPDRDRDGVGDACDPHPDLPIDHLAYFDPLLTFDAWETVAGGWSASGDAVTATPTLGNQLALLDLGVAGGRVFASPTIEVWVQSGNTVATGWDAGVYMPTAASTGALPPGAACYYNSVQQAAIFFEKRPVVGEGTEFPTMLFGNAPLRLALEGDSEMIGGVAGGPVLCVGQETGGIEGIATNPSDTQPIAMGRVGLYVYNGGATITSVTVIESHP